MHETHYGNPRLVRLMRAAKPRTKCIRTNRYEYYMLIMLMLAKLFRTHIQSNYRINLDA